jgi:hypothetical protein
VRRRHGIWVIVVGVMLALGVHGRSWQLYHLLRALGL